MSLRAGASAVSSNRRTRLVVALTVLAGTVTALPAVPAAAAGANVLTAQDFAYGTYIIDEPGVYRLGEDITFNPNSPARLTADVADGTIPSGLVVRHPKFPEYGTRPRASPGAPPLPTSSP